MNLRDRFRLASRIVFNNEELPFERHAQAFLSGADLDGDVRGENALKYSAVFACCRVLSETYASTPVFEYLKSAGGDREATNDLGLLDLFKIAPNPDMSAYNYHEMSLMTLNTAGNFYAEKVFNRFGQIIRLIPIDASRVEVSRSKSGEVQYEITAVDDPSRSVIRTKKTIFHIPGLSLDGIIGVSPLTYAASAVKLGLNYETFSNQFFKNGAMASGVFEHPGSLRDDAYARLKSDIKTNWTGLRNAGVPMLLEDGLKFSGLTVNPVDAQLLESKKFQVEDVCRVYRVPLHLVQNLDKATNNNIEHQSLEFSMYTMLPWFKRVESAINFQLIDPIDRAAGYFYEFNMAGLVRGDLKSRYAAYTSGRQWGWLSANDVRRFENQNSIGPEGDIYETPLNMAPAGSKVDDDVEREVDDVLNTSESR